MGSDAGTRQGFPRIVPTKDHIRAICGTWTLRGKVVRLYREPDTCVLLAADTSGKAMNPLEVITRGKKVEGDERH